jgi:predicted esterase
VVNGERIYIAGFSDGGMVASLVQASDPGTFKGGIYMCGALFWGDKPPEKLELMRNNRHVFIRGCFDPRERDVKEVYDEYRKAGFEDVELISVQTRRRRLPQPQYVNQAIRYVDGAQLEAAE